LGCRVSILDACYHDPGVIGEIVSKGYCKPRTGNQMYKQHHTDTEFCDTQVARISPAQSLPTPENNKQAENPKEMKHAEKQYQ